MRAGTGPREPASRAAVASRLELPLARVRRAERRGLRALRRIGREGCGAAARNGTGAEAGRLEAPAVGGSAAAMAVLAGSSGAAGGAGLGGRDPAGRESSGDNNRAGTGSGASGAVKGISAIGGPPKPGDTDIVLLLLCAVLVLTCVGGIGLEARRVWRSG
jgi:hypothetical protein